MKPELEKVHAVFLTETEEQLACLEQELLTLEAAPSPSSPRAVFRTVHTLKGGMATRWRNCSPGWRRECWCCTRVILDVPALLQQALKSVPASA